MDLIGVPMDLIGVNYYRIWNRSMSITKTVPSSHAALPGYTWDELVEAMALKHAGRMTERRSVKPDSTANIPPRCRVIVQLPPCP